MVDLLAVKNSIAWPPAGGDKPSWGRPVIQTLTGQKDWAMHKPLRKLGRQSAKVLERIEAVGAGADPSMFPDNGLVHFDLHTDNLLTNKNMVTGIIDWEEACSGDPHDLIQFAFDLDGHDQPIWNIVDMSGIDLQVLRAYVALLVLKCTSSAISHHPEDIARQLDRAERVFARYDI